MNKNINSYIKQNNKRKLNKMYHININNFKKSNSKRLNKIYKLNINKFKKYKSRKIIQSQTRK